MENPTYQLYSRMWNFLDLIFPPVCGGCEKRGDKWCENCDHATQMMDLDGCKICGGLANNPQRICRQCLLNPPVYDKFRSYAFYEGPLRKAIHRLKYSRDIGLGRVFGEKLAVIYDQVCWAIDIICPVPLSDKRMKQRGYNQAALIGLPFALKARLKYQPRALTRVRDTASQVNLSRDERRLNVLNAFQANEKYVAGKRVLVIDDVSTTGATLNACAVALKKVGAIEVGCLTLARTTGHWNA